MPYLSLAGVLSEMNQTEAQARSMLDLSIDMPTGEQPEEEVKVKEPPGMATPPVPVLNLEELMQRMAGVRGVA